MTVVVAYTQVDLDEDIDGIDADLDDISLRVGRIKSNWPQVEDLHEGVTAVEYIRSHVPWLAKNTPAAVALVESGVLSIRDAARVTDTAKSTVADRVKAKAIGRKPDDPKQTTLATGKTVPGPAIGTRKEPKPIAPRPKPALVIQDHYDKVWTAMAWVLAADPDHVIAYINSSALDDRQRDAVQKLMRSTAIRLNSLRKEVNR